MIANINLTPQEKALCDELGSFEINLDENYETRISKLEKCFALTESLFQRYAIPERRLLYFFNPEYNLSNPKKSHKNIFESNGTIGAAIYRHPHFLKYLKYFIYGADLPEETKNILHKKYESCTFDDDFVEVAYLHLKPLHAQLSAEEKTKFKEEVFKFCIDLGVDLRYSKNLKDKMKTRK